MNLGSDIIAALGAAERHVPPIKSAFGNHGTNLTGGVPGIDLDTNGTIGHSVFRGSR